MTPTDIIEFWLGPTPDDVESVTRASKRWYAMDGGLDTEIRNRFGPLIQAARHDSLAAWEETPQGALGLVILLDQFTRNAYRGTPEAFGGDALALAVATRTVECGLDRELGCAGRAVLYHPFEHSEEPSDQARSVALFEALAREVPPAWREFVAEFVPYAHSHRDVIGRFGRFPHRNPILGRASTPVETAYLAAGGGF